MNRIIRTSILYTVCCMTLLVCACSRSADVPEPGKHQETSNEVRVDVSSIQTKGTLTMSVDSIKSMGLFAYSTGTDNYNPTNPAHIPNLIYNQLAERDSGGGWVYDPVAYWPQSLSEKNTFFAYSPHITQFPEGIAGISDPGMSGNPTLTYRLPETLSDQQDILYATPVENINRTTNDGMVSYKMKHAMTWLAFVVAPVKYWYDTESYTVDWLAFMADDLTTEGTLDLGTGAWSNTTTDEVLFEFELTEAAQNIRPGEAPRIITESDRLMLFPIEIDSEKSGATIDLTFTYDPGSGAPDPRMEEDDEEYYYYIPFPTTRMTAGNVVVYMINISIDGISLTFLSENRIEDWIAGEGKEIEIY